MAITIDKNHLLQGENVVHLLTTKNVSAFTQGMPDSLVIHYTAGRDAESSARHLQQSNVKASAHIVIGRNGEIYQIVPFNTIAWHAGESSYGGRAHFNNLSIGIELDNAGELTKTGNEYISWFGKKYLSNEAIQAIHRNETIAKYWHIYTEKQLLVNEEITQLIMRHYPSITHVLGHEEISPGRKQDPGPAFPLDRFRRRLLGDNRDDQLAGIEVLPTEGFVVPNKLNIRAGAGSAFDKVAKPLASGQQVKILAEENGWYKVKTEIEGWVSKGFIEAK
ncbi:MAG: SH3 domain-containing protein [Cyclobacteriaceae bacterium]|nr:SH3 domain-containing protein [Cyclobacteriaceae bacterium]